MTAMGGQLWGEKIGCCLSHCCTAEVGAALPNQPSNGSTWQLPKAACSLQLQPQREGSERCLGSHLTAARRGMQPGAGASLTG